MWLEDGRSLFDVFGFDYTLLMLARGESETTPLVQAANKVGMPLTTVSLRGEEIRDLYEADFALIRPDQSVAWRGNKMDDPASIVDVVRGA